MINAAGIRVYSYLNITAVLDFFMEIKPGAHGRVTLRGYLAGMPDIRRLQEEAVRITLQEDGDDREQVLFWGIIQSVHTFVENGVCQVILSARSQDFRQDWWKKAGRLHFRQTGTGSVRMRLITT